MPSTGFDRFFNRITVKLHRTFMGYGAFILREDMGPGEKPEGRLSNESIIQL